jgi:hypothetical protein
MFPSSFRKRPKCSLALSGKEQNILDTPKSPKKSEKKIKI